MTGETTLFEFIPQQPPQKIQVPQREKCERIRYRDPTRQESVPLGPVPIRNWPLAIMTATEERKKRNYKDPVEIFSNGSEEKPATEWYLRRCLS